MIRRRKVLNIPEFYVGKKTNSDTRQVHFCEVVSRLTVHVYPNTQRSSLHGSVLDLIIYD